MMQRFLYTIYINTYIKDKYIYKNIFLIILVTKVKSDSKPYIMLQNISIPNKFCSSELSVH